MGSINERAAAVVKVATAPQVGPTEESTFKDISQDDTEPTSKFRQVAAAFRCTIRLI